VSLAILFFLIHSSPSLFSKPLFYRSDFSWARLSFLAASAPRPNSKRSHTLRYVLRNRSTGQVYLVILFTLYLKEDVNEDGSIKPHAFEAAKKASGHVSHGEAGSAEDSDEESFDEEKAIEEARRKLSGVGVGDEFKTSEDDVD
jgi:hypothetical protein